MTRLDLQELDPTLRDLIARAAGGERIVFTQRGIPVAELTKAVVPSSKPREPGR